MSHGDSRVVHLHLCLAPTTSSVGVDLPAALEDGDLLGVCQHLNVVEIYSLHGDELLTFTA